MGEGIGKRKEWELEETGQKEQGMKIFFFWLFHARSNVTFLFLITTEAAESR